MVKYMKLIYSKKYFYNHEFYNKELKKYLK